MNNPSVPGGIGSKKSSQAQLNTFAKQNEALSQDAVQRLAKSLQDERKACENREGQRLSLSSRRWVFALILLIQVAVNFDSGAIAASLQELQDKYTMGHAQAGLIGSMVYIGLVVGTLFAAPLLTHYSNKWVLIWSLLFNCGCALAFAPAPNSAVLLTLRFFIGMSQAFMVVYSPVWVDEFAPAERCTLWMAIVQLFAATPGIEHVSSAEPTGCVPMGIMIGYVTAGYLTANGFAVSLAFYVQAAAIFPLACALVCVPGRFLDTNHKEKPVDVDRPGVVASDRSTVDHAAVPRSGHVKKVARASAKLLRNGVYVNMTLALCSLYFVVTGIQLWITEYLTLYIGISKNAVVSAFAATSATAPILIFAVGCAIPVIFVRDFAAIIALIWFLLFFGGAIVPAATGSIMSCVPRRSRSFASSSSTCMYHLCGYFAGPTVAGIAAQAMGGTEWGMWIILASSGFGVIFLAAATICAHVRVVKYEKAMSTAGIQRLSVEDSTVDEEDDDVIYDVEAPHYTLRVPLPLAAPQRARINNLNRYTRFDDPDSTK